MYCSVNTVYNVVGLLSELRRVTCSIFLSVSLIGVQRLIASMATCEKPLFLFQIFNVWH